MRFPGSKLYDQLTPHVLAMRSSVDLPFGLFHGFNRPDSSLSLFVQFLTKVHVHSLSQLLRRKIEVFTRIAISARNAVPKGEELAEVVRKSLVMDGVAGRAVDISAVTRVLPFVDESGPHVDEGEESEVSPLVEREHENENRVRQSLDEPVQRVEGKARERRGDDPLVMLLVERFVQKRCV